MPDRSEPATAGNGSRPGSGKVAVALRFAVEAHLGQSRKDRRTPYIVHPVAVMRVLSSELGMTEPDVLCAALLHDVLEDTPRTFADVRAQFGPRVAQWVEELTIPHEFHGPTVPDSVKTELLVRATGEISWPAVLVKLADRVDNLRDSASAHWSPRKRRAFRDQTEEILKTVRRRRRSDPPPPALADSLRGAIRLLRVQLRRAGPEP